MAIVLLHQSSISLQYASSVKQKIVGNYVDSNLLFSYNPPYRNKQRENIPMYTIAFSAIFPRGFSQELKATFLEKKLSWRSVPHVGLNMWQSMALTRFANHRDSYYIGGNYGGQDTTLFQDEGRCVIMVCTIPTEYNGEFVMLLKHFLDSVAVEFDIDVNTGEE